MVKELRTKNIHWVHLAADDKEAVAWLQENFKFHPLDIEDVESGRQQPKVDFYDDYLFAIFHFPYLNKEENHIHVLELDVFLGKNYLVTVLKGEADKVAEIFSDTIMDKGSAWLAYKIVDHLTESSWPVIRAMSSQLNDIEDDIYGNEARKRTLRTIALIKRNLIRLKRIINPQILAVNALVHADRPYFKKDLSIYFDDIRDTLDRMRAIAESHSDVMNSLHHVYESLLSERTTMVIKLLTVISVSLLPLTLLSGIYGMNIDRLPFAHQPENVWLMYAGLLAIILSVIAYFRYRDWL